MTDVHEDAKTIVEQAYALIKNRILAEVAWKLSGKITQRDICKVFGMKPQQLQTLIVRHYKKEVHE